MRGPSAWSCEHSYYTYVSSAPMNNLCDGRDPCGPDVQLYYKVRSLLLDWNVGVSRLETGRETICVVRGVMQNEGLARG